MAISILDMVQYILSNTTQFYILAAYQTKTYQEKYRKNRFLSQPLRRLLCNAIIQPHFDYGCSAWYPYLNKSLKKKLQTLQNKCIRFCLNLNNRDHIGLTEFEKINWLPINDRFEQCISSTTFKFFNNKSPAYMNDIFKPAGHPNTNT